MIYTPAEDSFLLASVLKKYVSRKNVLDMGTGTGIQAETALEDGAKSVLAVDISEESVKLVASKNLSAIKSDLFDNVDGKFEVILFNPPYLPEDKREDSESSLITTGGKKGDEIVLRFLKQASEHLEKKGHILLLLSSLTPRKRIESTLKKLNLVYKKIASKSLFMETLEVWEIVEKQKR